MSGEQKSHATLFPDSFDQKVQARKDLKGKRVRITKWAENVGLAAVMGPGPWAEDIAVPLGSEGTVEQVDDVGTLHVLWDNGRRLGVVMEDTFEEVTEARKEAPVAPPPPPPPPPIEPYRVAKAFTKPVEGTTPFHDALFNRAVSLYRTRKLLNSREGSYMHGMYDESLTSCLIALVGEEAGEDHALRAALHDNVAREYERIYGTHGKENDGAKRNPGGAAATGQAGK